MWQDLQLAVATTLWFMVTADAKLVCERWHESHLAVPMLTGMCVAGLPLAVLPLWQVSQVPVPTALAAEWANTTVNQLAVDLWQLSQPLTMVLWVVLLGRRCPGAYVPMWQVWHWLPTDTLLCRRAGVQAVKPDLWQVSQLGMATPVSRW